MVEQLKRKGRITVRKVENAYAVLAMVCTTAASVKVATLPHVKASFGLWKFQIHTLAVWQVVAGVLLGGLLYAIYQLIEHDA